MSDILLDVKHLKTYFFLDEGVSQAVDGMDFTISRGRTLGMIGESGCGKSVSALSILQLIPMPPGKIISGEIFFEGQDLLQKSKEEPKKVRGNEISMIFQEPMTSLNPVFTIGDQIAEVLRVHRGMGRAAALPSRGPVGERRDAGSAAKAVRSPAPPVDLKGRYIVG